MCTCASCSYTDKHKAGFAEWPRGEPAGKRSSESAYRAHVKHSQQWGRRQNGNMHQPPEFSASELKGTRTAESGATRYQRPAGCFPGPADVRAGMKAYIAAFDHLNGLKPVPIAKPVPYLLALARELRRAA
jgi:hypothetical protein